MTHVLGCLIRVLVLFNEHTEDGVVDGYEATDIDKMVELVGFTDAMIQVGWFKKEGRKLVMLNFARHNGMTAKRKAKHTVRVENN